jgi:DNA-binding MarR family transcriptional regulator
MKTLPLTTKQRTILYYLYTFRFLTVSHVQKLLSHKDPHRVKVWLKDLRDKGYVAAIVDEKDVTKPYIYCLDSKARKVVKELRDCNPAFLDRLYKEKHLTSVFQNHCLFIADAYLYFLSHKEPKTTLHFITRHDLVGYEYFPEELPDAYIAVESARGTSRYFLEVFDEYRKAVGIARFTVRNYIKYCEEGCWENGTNNAPFPALLFVFQDEKRKKHIFYYGKAKLEKCFETISLFLTTQDAIKFSRGTTSIWQPV